ncbi:hypothetical protein VitviT2T_013679 [Vitis vinifera]|uniref:Uncharacterized protein n=1 Tax=Vitis vinifera TaxID=29760 RepID=A0ABY9CJY0_VITVI|nr:hypothetical protein VitviT2T_013679 [Vitis vinifera]
MLAQLDDSGKDRAIYYLSKRMLDYETRYVMIERYCLALVWATRRLRHYMTEYSVHLISRLDPLRYLFDRPALVGRLMRWLVLLTEFDIHYVTQKSIRGSIVADHLASLLVSDARAIDDDFPDEDVAVVTSLSGWRMYFDGAANHSGYGIGVLLISPHGDHIPRSVRLAFSDRHPATNNIVEYEACILGLKTALELGIRQMEVFGDSNLVLRQIQGEWKTRDVKLKPYHAYLELLVGRFDDLRYTHLPRAQNQFVDALATLASMIDIPVDAIVRPLLIESRSAPAYCCLIDDVEPDDGLPWYHDIYHFLRLGVYPEAATAKDKRALRQLATRFVICGETLYRRSPDGILLLCLDRASADRVMREVHAGVCGPHMGGHMLARKIMRTGYFWLTMETDCCQFVQRCPECQIHGDLIHVPPSELHALTSPWPFSVWGIDIIGKISPKSSSGHEFILVAIDYFTKWVEAASYARLTSSGVASFIRSHIICRYGVPHELISDRGVHFRAEVDTLVQRYSIRHHRLSAYRPQTNGAVEAANKNIKRILRRMVETSRDWSEKLPFALWAYRTSFRTSTGATPYSLVYGMEAMLPVEIEMGSLRVALEQQIPEADWAQARFDQLNLLDERRLRAADHVRAYQRKMARAFKKWVKPRPLWIGDLVLKVIRGLIRDPRGKFRPNWSGPYFIRELTPEGAAWLMDLDGNRFSEPTNVDQLKRHSQVHGSWGSLYMLHFIYEGMSFDHWVFEPSFLSFLSPYHLGLRYVPCLKTTLRPWDQMSSSAASTWTEVTCSRIDDFMLSDLRPIVHFDAIQGHISIRMRFTDHERVACLSLFGEISPLVYMIIYGYEIHAKSMFDFILSGYSEEPLLSHSARFIPFDIVVIPGWSRLWCLDFPRHHPRGVHIRSVMRPIGVILGSSRQIGGASFETRRVPFSYFQRIEICSGISHWGIPPCLSLSDLLCTSSLLNPFLDLCESSYWGISPLALFYWGIPPLFGFTVSSVDFMDDLSRECRHRRQPEEEAPRAPARAAAASSAPSPGRCSWTCSTAERAGRRGGVARSAGSLDQLRGPPEKPLISSSSVAVAVARSGEERMLDGSKRDESLDLGLSWGYWAQV